MFTALKDNKLFLVLILAVITSVINQYLLVGVFLLSLIMLFSAGSKNLLKSFFLFALLTIVSDLGESIRSIIQISTLILFFILFFQDYGLNFSRYKKVPRVVILFLIYLFSVMLITTIFSRYPGAGFFLIGRTALFFLLTYILYSLIYNDRDAITLFKILLSSALVITLSVIVEFIQSGGQLFNFKAHLYTRSSGILSNVNTVGGLISNLIPLLLGMLFYKKITARNSVLITIGLIILYTGIFLVASRASYIAVFISTIIVITFFKRDFLKWLLIPGGIILLLFYFYEPISSLFELLTRVDEGLAGREIFWNLAINIIKQNPILGIGPGAYQYEAYNYFPVLLDSWHGQTISHILRLTGGSNASHSIFLVYFSDMGILGLTAALMLPVVFYKISIPVLGKFKNVDEFKYIFTVSVLAMGSGDIIRAFFEPALINYGYITADLPFWMFFAIICHFYRLIGTK